MASNIYVKSLIWLSTLGGIGYVLMRLTEPSEEKLKKIRATKAAIHLTEDEKKKLLFMKRLQEAAGGTPIYLKKKEDN